MAEAWQKIQSGLGVGLTGSFHHDGQPLFSNLDINLASGKWTCLLGPSGVGKSTLLRLFASLPTGGKFTGEITADDNGPIEGRISYMAQSDLLFPWLNVEQNVILGNQLRGETPDHERAVELIRCVGLDQHVHKRPSQLSGGMRQRVALARTLMEDRPVVLLDEPFSALDARTRSDMQELAFDVLQGKTVLLVTHEPAEAVRLSHYLYLMSGKGLVAQTVDAGEPIRGVVAKATLKAQAKLLVDLRRDGDL